MGTYEYELGEKICNWTNVHKFQLSYDNRPPKHYSAVEFNNVEGANSFIEALKKYQNHPNVAIPHDVILKKGGSGAYAVMEPLSSFQNWASKPNKTGMWDVIADNNGSFVCVGLGDSFKTTFAQLGSALAMINADGVVLNDFRKGVMFGKDGQVRIFNFFLNKEKEKEKKKRRPKGQSQAQAADAIEEAKASAVYDDFSKFVGFLEEVAGYDPAPSTFLSDDIQILKKLSLSFPKPTTMSEIKKLVKWIYKAPMFWNKRKILILFKFLSVMYKENKKLFVALLFYQKWYPNWRTDIGVNSDMKKCYQHNNLQNLNYRVIESFILFIRNFLVHPPGSSTEIDAYHALLLLFPQLLGKTWNDMFTARDDARLVLRKNAYAGTFEDYIEKELSLFVLDKPK